MNYTVTGTDANGCVDTDVVQVTVNSLPTVNAGANQTICLGASALISATGAVSYSWNHGLGAGVSHAVFPLVTRWYTVTGIDVNGCENMDAVRILVSAAYDASILMLDTSICYGDFVLGIPIVDAGGEWSGNGISDVNNGNFNSILSGTGIFQLNYLIDNACGDEDSVLITVLELPNVQITSNASSVCEEDSIDVSVTGAASYSWNNGLGSNSNYTLYLTGTTTYIVEGVGTNQCVDSDTITINFLELPTIVMISSESEICNGEVVTLSVTGADSYNWQGGGTNSQYSFNESSSQFVVVEGESLGCNIKDSVFIEVHSIPLLTNLSSVSEICIGESISILVSGADSYVWSFDNFNGDSQILSPEENTTYTIVGSSVYGCKSSIEISVVVNVCEPEIFIPEGFTPNVDGINDSFEIVGLEEYPENEVFILNRWGGIVYEQKGYQNDWNAVGNNASGKVIEGTYFYILKLNDYNNNVYKGTLEITYK